MKYILLCLIFIHLSYADDQLQKADDLFNEALKEALKDDYKAKQLYEKSAEQYELFLAHSKLRNGKIYYNLANAYFFSDELGLAILNYRKAELYMPYNEQLQHNIKFTKGQTADDMSSLRNDIYYWLFIWHNRLSTLSRLFIMTVFLALFWFCIYRKLYSGKIMVLTLSTSAILSFILALSISKSLFFPDQTIRGVVTQKETTPRKGNSFVYESAFDGNLHAGTEFTLIEKRDNWHFIELENGKQCWLPSYTVGLVETE